MARVWIADATDPTIGRLSLLHRDRRHRHVDRPERRAAGRHRPARVLDRRRPARLGDPTRPGRRRQPVQIVAWTGDVGRRDRERPGRRRRRRPLRPRARGERCAAPRFSVRACRRGRMSGVSSGSRATQQVGRRVGAHRRPRPGRAAGSRRFADPEPARTDPGQRVPAALGPRGRRAVDSSDRRRSMLPMSRPARSPPDDAVRRARRSARCRRRRRGRPSTSPTPVRRRRKPPRYTLTGFATFYDNGTTAMRLPRGTLVVICGGGGCIERVVNDYGPQQAVADRRPLPAGLLRRLRLPVVVAARRRSRSTSTDDAADPARYPSARPFSHGPVRPPGRPREAGKER